MHAARHFAVPCHARLRVGRNYVLPGTNIHTDEGSFYRTLARRGYKHPRVTHRAHEYGPAAKP